MISSTKTEKNHKTVDNNIWIEPAYLREVNEAVFAITSHADSCQKGFNSFSAAENFALCNRIRAEDAFKPMACELEAFQHKFLPNPFLFWSSVDETSDTDSNEGPHAFSTVELCDVAHWLPSFLLNELHSNPATATPPIESEFKNSQLSVPLMSQMLARFDPLSCYYYNIMNMNRFQMSFNPFQAPVPLAYCFVSKLQQSNGENSPMQKESGVPVQGTSSMSNCNKMVTSSLTFTNNNEIATFDEVSSKSLNSNRDHSSTELPLV